MAVTPYVVLSTDHGSMIVNRFDYHTVGEKKSFGVGFQLLTNGCYDAPEIGFLKHILNSLVNDRGSDITVLDCGANIGVHTIELSKALNGHGRVISIEAQRQVYYALCGNIAINNCFNVEALHVAVGDAAETISIPQPNYFIPSSFGSMEIKQSEKSENIGQSLVQTELINQITLDSLSVNNVALLKIDVEGMEFEALAGAERLISNTRPIIWIEHIKVDERKLKLQLESWGYKVYNTGMNYLAIHNDDNLVDRVSESEGVVSFR